MNPIVSKVSIEPSVVLCSNERDYNPFKCRDKYGYKREHWIVLRVDIESIQYIDYSKYPNI